ncbi:MAG: MdtA/MuxA family multidrug efflux RND transporter periplasmic adaptor subunit [Lacunisphaera sp.]
MTDKPSSSRRRWPVYAGIVAAAALGVWYFSTPGKQARRFPNPAWAGQGEPITPVKVVAAERRQLPVHLKAIGTVTPLNTVTVQSRVDGQLLRVAFTEGQQVEPGALLAEIDPAPYRIQLAQAMGQQKQNQATLETARADLERFQVLFDKKLLTNQEMEAQRSLVRAREGAVAADQAQVDEARLQLAYTRIESPISGRVGLRRVDAGNLIKANNPDGLVTITQTRPVAVMFTVPEVDLDKVVAPLRAGGQLVVEAWDRSGNTLLARGVLKTVDNQIDLATGTLKLKAEFPNADEKLFPNQFVNVRLQVSTLKDAIVIPAAAVQFGSRGTYVYVINAKSQSTIRPVVLGPTDGVSQAVSEGLTPGDPGRPRGPRSSARGQELSWS